MRVFRIILSFIFLGIAFCTRAQKIERYNSFSYSVNEGLLQSTISDIAFDKNNFCWISFPNGIQKFDGSNFINVPIQKGLPDDKFAVFLNCSNGNLLISHGQGISNYNVGNNKFTLVYTGPTENKAWFIGEDENTAYFYNENGYITGIDINSFKVVKKTKTNFPDYFANTDNRPKISSNIKNHKFAFHIKSRLYLWDLKKAALVSQSDSIPEIAPYFLTLKNDDQVYYYTNAEKDAIFSYNFTNKTNSRYFIKGKDDSYIGRCIIYPWKNNLLISFNNRLYKIDSALQQLGAEIVNFQNKPIAGNNAISLVKEDNYGNLVLQTVLGGIKKLIRNNYPVKYYGTEKREDNNTLSILPDKNNNRILVGVVEKGLMVFDTLQHLVKHIKTLPGSSKSFSPNNIVKDNGGNYLLFNVGATKAWRISSNFSKIDPIPISWSSDNSWLNYFGNFLYQDQSKAIIQSQGWVYRINFGSGIIEPFNFTNSYTMGGLWYKNVFISHANDELIFLDATTFAPVKKIKFRNTGYVRCFTVDAANDIYVGSNKGIFKIDMNGKILLHLTKQNGLPDECIYAMVFDKQGFLWCSTNKGIFKLSKDNSILQLTKEDGLQENEFNTNVIATAEDGELFFGGVNGVSSFYPNSINNFEEKISLLVTQVKVNNNELFKDTAVWNIKEIELPYDENSLSFDFIAMANNNPGQYIYQYKMDGIDEQWIQNTGLQTVRYFLPPGHYTFKIYAGRSFDKDAKAMKEIHIIINPPFWKTWWFITGIVLLSIGGLAYTFNRYNKKKYQQKLAVLENEHRIQVERERISRDLHDSIGAYANAVLYNTELLQKENNAEEKIVLMNDLKFASKDIITSLRETVWALKKDNYTAEECLLRIKNFMQALSRYYPLIHFKVEGIVSEEKILHHNKALHVVRIVQEAVTNAIKHASANNISLSSNEYEGKWELTVIDDGKGFDYEAMKRAETGNGLLNMTQRVTEAGFDYTVSSAPGIGTKITMLIS